MSVYRCLGKVAHKSIVICACISILLLSSNTVAYAKINYTADKKTETIVNTEVLGYIGKVTRRVNVRVAAGEKNDKLLLDGKDVQLQDGEEVLIVTEEMVGKKPWYQVKFTRDGKELVGFATSTYINKTETAVTPSPTPTPEPTATPTPTKTPTVTIQPTEQPVVENNSETSASTSNTPLYIGIAVVICLGIGCIIAATNKKKKSDREDPESALSKKVEELKKIKFSDDDKEKPIATMRRRPEVKASNVNSEVYRPENHQDVYVSKKNDTNAGEEFAATKEITESMLVNVKSDSNIDTEIAKANLIRENEEKQALRVAIENLREHDIVIHKYFGKGEVFDNSDVRLIEVRFKGDARFLNKESLASKKLLTITNERKR